jgi:hypothetical protein
MVPRCTIRSACLLTIFIGQAVLSFVQPALALDLDNMIKEGIKQQLPGANHPANVNQVTGGSPLSGPSQQAPIKVDRQVQRLEDLIPRQDIPYGFPPMIPMQGISIAGLGQKATLSLGANYFVVRSNTNAVRMADLYRENKTACRANFVTIDCVVHPYLAFTNRIFAETIKKHLMPMTRSILLAMLKVALSDYKQADDEEVKADIESNVAFISLALKLIDSGFVIPAIGRVPQLVQADYDAVVFARPGHSTIFDRNEDFSFYRPLGWYRSSPELFTFYRVKTWLSRMYFPINDVTFDSAGVRANNFRRSVLLYRSLDLARIEGKPAIETWMRLVRGMFLLGAQVENWQEKNLYAHDYKSVFRANSADLKMTLNALSDPLYRTKLLLAVRRQKPVSLGSTSIFDLEESKQAKEVVAAFRFIPATGAPEEPWLRYAAALYPRPQVSTNVFPVALLDLNAWGAPQASNSLLDSSWAMDDSMPATVSELKRWVLRRAIAGQVQPVECRIWSMLAPSWRLLPEGIQTVVRGQSWSVRRLETVFSAWLDSLVSIAPPRYASSRTAGEGIEKPEQSPEQSQSLDDKIRQAIANVRPGETKNAPAASLQKSPQIQPRAGENPGASSAAITAGAATGTGSGAGSSGSNIYAAPATAGTGVNQGAAGSSSVPPAGSAAVPNKVKPMVARKAARGHFLDPYPDFYNRVLIDIQRLDQELTALGFALDPGLKRGLDDYARLFQRLFKIAKDEVDGKQLGIDDLSLLANIDIILDKIDLPLPAVVNVEPQVNFNTSGAESSREAGSGFTMALGRPGLLHVILMNKATHEWTLARGAVYTYYEQYGTALGEEALLNKIDRGGIQPPYWAEQFDFVQADKK